MRHHIIPAMLLLMSIATTYAQNTSTMNERSTTARRNVAIVVHDGVELLDFSGPGEVFAAAEGERGPLFNVYTISPGAGPILSQGFVTVTPQYTIANCPRPDIIVIPGGGTRRLIEDTTFMAWLIATAKESEIVMTVCTGAMSLAKAGLLDGLQATTWHGAIDRLRELAPKTIVHENTRFVDNGKFVTTAGVSAGIDGALHIVSRLHGEDVARKTARYMEYDKWEPNAGLVVEVAAAKATD